MKIINLEERQVPCDVLDDCIRIQRIMARSYIFTLPEILSLWSEFSDSVDANWMIPYTNDNHVFEAVIEMLD